MIEPSIFYKIVKNRVMRVESELIKVLASTVLHRGTSPSLRFLTLKWDHNGIYLIMLL